MSRDFCVVARRSISWSSSLNSAVSAASKRGAGVSIISESRLARTQTRRRG